MTSIMTRIAFLGMVMSSRILISSVEFWMQSGYDRASGCNTWSMNFADGNKGDVD